jgi:hypothetical protein
VAVVQRRSVVAAEGYDYADAFATPMDAADGRSAEELVRAGLGQVPRWLGMVVFLVQRHVLRLELASGSSPNHVLGWEILTAERDCIRLGAAGPLLHGVLVARRVPPSTAVLETFVSYRRPVPARIAWTVVAPIHRAVAQDLLRRAATVSDGR